MPAVTSLGQVEDDAPDADIIILYIHVILYKGGGFSTGFSTMHMPAFRLIIKELQQKHQLRGRILSVDYTPSPKAVWPQGHNACIDAYRYLIHDLGVPPSHVVIAGDEAGANLAATIALSVKDQRSQERLKDLPPLPLPAGLGLISPWSDITPFHEDIQGNTAYQRPALLAKYVRGYIKNYYQLQEVERERLFKHPLVSPYYGDYSDMCPVFVGYGEKELLCKSVEHYIDRMKGFGDNQVTILEGKGCDHNWIMCKLLANNLKTFESGCKEFVDWMANTIKDRQIKQT
ncbi:alpha/beta-hydrolase [Backusella circina FSU 941]|nr:alpha/beta-hydrolase [Backusella circina FSU 941]